MRVVCPGLGSGHVPHIDRWIGAATDPGVVACGHALTPDGVVEEVEVAPSPHGPVDIGPLYADGRSIAG